MELLLHGSLEDTDYVIQFVVSKIQYELANLYCGIETSIGMHQWLTFHKYITYSYCSLD